MQGVGDDQLFLPAGQVVVPGQQQVRERLDRGAGIQDHGTGLGMFEYLEGFAGDGPFLIGREARSGVHPLFAARGLVHGHGTAVHTAQFPLGLEDGEIPADRLHGHTEPLRQSRTVDTALVAHGACDLLVAFCSEHLHLTDRGVGGETPV